jgi:peptidoglycan/xylan/chitin deacetylase (PgdA/CDA1 family)
VSDARLAITIDVDGEAGLPDGGRDYGERLTSRSERAYGVLRGLPRLLRILDEHHARATFYVPGVTALRHAPEIAGILDRGHELGHHGHTHRRPDTLDADEQRREIELGRSALERFDARPAGYRAPGWELTPATLSLLAEHGFAWDSSLMGDDRPYLLPAGDATIVELPVHWSLDDAPYFTASPDGGRLWEVWRAEILGRPGRAEVLSLALTLADGLAMRVVTHGELARGVH